LPSLNRTMKTARALSRIFSINVFLYTLFFCFSLLFTHPSVTTATPEATAAVKQERISLNKQFVLNVHVAWQGQAEDFIVVPPEPSLPEGLELVASSFTSSVQDERHGVSYAYVLGAQKKGHFTLDPIKVPYWAKGSEQENFVLTNQVSFDVVSFAFFRSGRMWLPTAGCIGIIGIIILAVFIRDRRRGTKKSASEGTAPCDMQCVMEKLQQCKQAKLQGDPVLFFQNACSAAEMLYKEDPASIGSFKDLLERVRFGGHRPPAEEIERFLRQLEKRAETLFPSKKNREDEYKKYCETP